MSFPAAAAPARGRLYRRPDVGWVGGVAAGLAAHLGLRARVVRLVFVGLAFAGGFGVALYGAFWIVLPISPDAGRPRLPRWAEYLIGSVVAVSVLLAVTSGGSPRGLAVPLLLGGVGAALMWRQAGETDRDRWRRLSRTSFTASGDRIGRARIAAGVAFIVAGAVLVLADRNLSRIGSGLFAVIVTLLGVVLVTGPWWMRMVGQLGTERAARIREQERAEIAAHLHDSVLQTLALIQRNAGSPREVTRLARGQERELRSLLYGPREPTGQLAAALQAVAAEVEDAYAVAVDTVVVGDTHLDERLGAAVAATREALVNAGKHAQVEAVSLYAEVEDDGVSIFVKDRGAGFDPDQIADDRQGVRGSIVERVARHGGTTAIRSRPGDGTEVEITMPRSGQ